MKLIGQKLPDAISQWRFTGLRRFHTIPACDRQTDDGQMCFFDDSQ